MIKFVDKLVSKMLFNDVPADNEVRLRKDERDVAILSGKYPADGADIESISEYRLARLVQYPHY
jgi:hypothetical protein